MDPWSEHKLSQFHVFIVADFHQGIEASFLYVLAGLQRWFVILCSGFRFSSDSLWKQVQ